MQNFNVIKGEQISNYITTAISLGVSKKPNRQGQLSEFAVFTINDEEAMGTKGRNIIIFNDEKPEIIERLKPYCKEVIVNNEKRNIVDMNKLVTDLEAEPELIKKRDVLYSMLEFKGGMVTQYKLRKGLCYMNDVNGNPVKDRHGKVITRDSVTIFVWIKNMVPNEEGGFTTNYYDGYTPWEQGQRMEDRFFEKPVEGHMSADDAINMALNPTSPVQDVQGITTQQAQQQSTTAQQAPNQPAQQQQQAQPQAAQQNANPLGYSKLPY